MEEFLQLFGFEGEVVGVDEAAAGSLSVFVADSHDSGAVDAEGGGGVFGEFAEHVVDGEVGGGGLGQAGDGFYEGGVVAHADLLCSCPETLLTRRVA
ncbi:hypothetical protein OG218_01200 [Kineococcus sp. NBC_00420]